MAGASSASNSTGAGGTPAFSRFRLNQFIDDTPKHARTASETPPTVTTPMASETPVESPAMNAHDTPEPTASEQPAELASASTVVESNEVAISTPQSAPATTTTPAARVTLKPAKITPAPPRGFAVLDLATATRKAVLGPLKDGRVRNPVPGKLKGKTDEKQGNFAVMHMDLTPGAMESKQRERLAQRVSEGTAAQAASAQTDRYVSYHRRRYPATSESPAYPKRGPGRPPLAVPRVHRQRALMPDEVKHEQARLLTLLRSISPLAVVDQLCTAVAFFAGIPSAPPPDAGAFPESAEFNGSGALFIGWLSEIFPDPMRTSWAPGPEQGPPVKRGRGRPKGSKGTKVRKDKGIKKGPRKPKSDSHAAGPSSGSGGSGETHEADGDWVDIEPESPDRTPSPTSMEDGGDLEDEDDYDEDGNDQEQDDDEDEDEDDAEEDDDDGDDDVVVVAVDRQLQGDMEANQSSTQTPQKRGPGRPKGSVKKQPALAAPSGPANRKETPILPPGYSPSARPTGTEETPKRKRGRPPKNKSQEPATAQTPTAPIDPATGLPVKRGRGRPRKNPIPNASPAASASASAASGIPPGLTAEEQAVLVSYRQQKQQEKGQGQAVTGASNHTQPPPILPPSTQSSATLVSSQVSPSRPSQAPAQVQDAARKRKRPTNNESAASTVVVADDVPESIVQSIDAETINNHTDTSGVSATAGQVNPGAKRQRRGRPSTSDPSEVGTRPSSEQVNASATTSPLASSAVLQNGSSVNRPNSSVDPQFDFTTFSQPDQAQISQRQARMQVPKQQSGTSQAQMSQMLQAQAQAQAQARQRPPSQNQNRAQQLTQKPGQNASRISQNAMGHSSPVQSSVSPFYQQSSHMSAYNQQYRPQQAYHLPTSNDGSSYRQATAHQMQNQRSQTFSPQQQQAQVHAMSNPAFNHPGFSDNSYIDLSTLDSSSGLVGYGGMQPTRGGLGSNNQNNAFGATSLDGTYDNGMGDMRRR